MSVCLFDCLPSCLSVYIFDHICYTYLPVCLCELIVFTYFVVCVSHRQKLSIMIESFTYTSLCISLSFSMCLCLSVAIRGWVGYFHICVKTTRSSFFLSFFLFFLIFPPFFNKSELLQIWGRGQLSPFALPPDYASVKVKDKVTDRGIRVKGSNDVVSAVFLHYIHYL